MKNKVENILGGFLERNKDYAVEIYVKNGITDNFMARLLVPIKRYMQQEEDNYSLRCFVGNVEFDNIEYDNFSLPYDEVLDCYEEKHEKSVLAICPTVVVILKNGMKFEFRCIGLKI